MPADNKNRSLRLRKKLHLGEFTEYGFNYNLTFRAPLSGAADLALLEAFINEVVDARRLGIGGSTAHGFIACHGDQDSMAADREAVRSWLSARPEVASADVGPLVDAWN